MFLLKWLLAPSLLLVGACFGTAHAQNPKRMDVSEYLNSMKTNICPARPTKIDPLPVQMTYCGGDGTKSPCENGDMACNEAFTKCVRIFNADKAVIISYNKWLADACK